ncbi:DivIVA domain-containing protein [Thermosulfurimonas dismutans]|uniref:Cell division initiation protein DivIVA n=1 Tax=Thermosulfurimonas dismutans TaxID=999894 RepID=A0A179D1K3_9BACT|nr:DivIVA domain-containing protein [Thermosulfurimonas dismutans]OAQ19955.1 Cell division initiation protein DivIVA [Thermosulfurimonas dismutans]
MRLTPKDIREKSFNVVPVGYSRKAVRTFLEEVADFVKEVIRENNQLRDELSRKDREIEELMAEAKAFREALRKLDEFSETIKAQAEAEARKIVEEAEKEAKALEEDIERLWKMREKIRLDLRSLLLSYLEHLEERVGDRGSSQGGASQSPPSTGSEED